MSFDICVFGDSIVRGAGDTVAGGYVSRLGEYIHNKHDSYFTYNCGVSGDNTDDLIKRFKVEALGREADVIVFAIGINDSQYIQTKDNPRVSLGQFADNMQYLINQAKEITDKIAVVGLTNIDETLTMPISWSPTKFYDRENVSIYNNQLANVAMKNTIPFLSLIDTLETSDLIDGLHPNESGYQKIYTQVRFFLEQQGRI